MEMYNSVKITMVNCKKLAFVVLIIFCSFVLIGGKKRSIGIWFILKNDNFTNGDLYNFCEIDDYKEVIKCNKIEATNKLENCNILTLGDSFFASSLDSDNFANELQKKSGHRIYNIDSDTDLFSSQVDMPIAYFDGINYRSNKRRLLILETVERYSLKRSELYNLVKRGGTTKRMVLGNKLFDNSDIEHFFKNNIVVKPVYKYINNARYRLFGTIDHAIGKYSRSKAMLFFREDIEFSNKAKTDKVVNAMVANVTRLSNTLKCKYNIDLVYVIIPDKFSIYNDYVTDNYKYDNFIPAVAKKLTSNGISVVDIYSKYMEYRSKPGAKLLYYGSDTHFTPTGKQLLIEECIKVIEQKQLLN